MHFFGEYVEGLASVLRRIDCGAFDRVVDVLRRAHAEDKTVYICGNGGSAATASHMVNDLVKAPADASGCRPFRAIALADCVPLLTAYANDIAYAEAFGKQVEAYGRAGDVLIIFSGSGNSANVLVAAKTACAKGMTVVGVTGFQGGRLKDLCDVHLNVPCECMAQIEDAHLILEHALIEAIKVVFGGKSTALKD